MDARFDYNDNEILQKFVQRLVAASDTGTTLAASVQHLVKIRASQINGCSACTDMHTKDAAHDGESAVRLNLVAVWREATVFTEAEQAALELAEAATRIADAAGGVSDEVWGAAAAHFDPDELAGLVCTITLINAFNRLNVMNRTPAGDYVPGQWG